MTLLLYRCESARENLGRAQADLGDELADFGLALVDEVRSHLRVRAVKKRLARGEHAAADPIARIDDGDLRALLCKLASSCESGQPCAGDENGNAAHLASRLSSPSTSRRWRDRSSARLRTSTFFCSGCARRCATPARRAPA